VKTETLSAPRRGRPLKFARPARAVTLTLPEDVIGALQAIDPDLARSVVRLVQPYLAQPPRAPAELSAFGNRSVIVVPCSRQLGARTGVELVPMSDGRALIAFDEDLSVPQVELRVADAVSDPELSANDRTLFESLGTILRESRRSPALELQRRSIIVVKHAKRAGRTTRGSSAGRRTTR
jgi:hypothetical protein